MRATVAAAPPKPATAATTIQQSIQLGTALQQTAQQSAATAAILIQKPIVIITAVTMTARQKIPAINPLTPSINLKKPTAATAHHTGTTTAITIILSVKGMTRKVTKTGRQLAATIGILILSVSRILPAATVRGKLVIIPSLKIIQKIMLSGKASIMLILILLKVPATNRQ